MYHDCPSRRSQLSVSTHNTLFFFFNDTATTEIYTLSLHDALPISAREREHAGCQHRLFFSQVEYCDKNSRCRSEEHTSELQSLRHLVCRLLLEKKKKSDAKAAAGFALLGGCR